MGVASAYSSDACSSSLAPLCRLQLTQWATSSEGASSLALAPVSRALLARLTLSSSPIRPTGVPWPACIIISGMWFYEQLLSRMSCADIEQVAWQYSCWLGDLRKQPTHAKLIMGVAHADCDSVRHASHRNEPRALLPRDGTSLVHPVRQRNANDYVSHSRDGSS